MPKRISAAETKAKHQIFTLHERMDNKELRFRLLHENGTGYILTQATPESGWQKSHVHEHVMETYVVQSGWMALAELIDNGLAVRTFEVGEMVTTQPRITHNVYLPADAVIHTVKHGSATGSDRQPGPDGPTLDLLTEGLDCEAKIKAAAIRSHKIASYPEKYRHFDNLIWQVPAWATAIFALSIQSVLEMTGRSNLDAYQWRGLAVLTLFLAASIACFSVVLARFRVHQRVYKGYAHTRRWISASTWSQSLLSLQVAVLVGVALVFSGMLVPWAIGLVSASVTVIIIATEILVRKAALPKR